MTENVGVDIVITCTATGLGNLMIQRTSTAFSNPVTTVDQGINSITGAQGFVGLRVSDGGTYTCEVSNEAGSVTASATLNIRPVFTMTPTNIWTNNGSSEMLICEADGFPFPQLQWTKLNAAGMYEDIPGETAQKLEFDPIVFGDEGVYRCVAGEAFSSSSTVTGIIVYTRLIYHWH